MTGVFDCLLAVLLSVLWNAVIISRIQASHTRPEANFLARVYAWTLILRYSLAVFLNIYSQDYMFALNFWGDSTYYDGIGDVLARSWSGEVFVDQGRSLAVSGYGFTYFVAAIYYIFGRNQLLVQLINGTIGALAVLVIHAIAKDLFDSRVARWAALFMAFFPQMIFWSGAMYKDPAIILCIALCMFALLKLRRSFTVTNVLLFLASSFALMTLRFYIFYFVAFATVGTFAFAQRRRFVGSIFAQVSLMVAFVAAFSFAAGQEALTEHASYFDLERVQVSRFDLARSARSGFEVQADVSTVSGALSVLPIGFVYLMFAPFPWAISGIRQALTLPETLVWYALMPALVRGLVYTARYRLRAALPILVYAVSLTVAYALFQGNVGTAYRQRTQISMFYFVFMGVGLVNRRRSVVKEIGPSSQPLPAAETRA